MRTMRILGTVIILALLVTSCSGPYSPRERKGATPQFSKKILYTDKALVKRLLVANHQSYRESDGRLTVKCALENRKKEGIWADVRIVFYDQDHFEVDKTNWQPHYFEPLAVKEVSVSSLNSMATDYSILLRHARTNVK